MKFTSKHFSIYKLPISISLFINCTHTLTFPFTIILFILLVSINLSSSFFSTNHLLFRIFLSQNIDTRYLNSNISKILEIFQVDDATLMDITLYISIGQNCFIIRVLKYRGLAIAI